MPVPIPGGVYFSYNGFAFPVYCKTKVTEEPVTSGDNRTVKYSKITINVSGWITQNDVPGTPPQTLDTLMQTLRVQLQKHGKPLRYQNKGYGANMVVNDTTDGSSVRDVNMGPKAGALRWWPLGGAPAGCYGAGFEWSVTTWLPECTNPTYLPEGNFSEVSFTVSFETAEDGLVTRTTNGTAQIPLSLNDSGGLDTNIDVWLGNVITPQGPGFLRHMQRQISADRSSCTFTITDRQIEVPYPEDVVVIDMKHRIRPTNLGMTKWVSTIRGTIRLNPPVPKAIAYQRFFNIVAQRIIWTRTRAVSIDRNGRQTSTFDLMAPQIEIEENLFKNEATFSIQYQLVGALNVETILLASGLWTPVQSVIDGQTVPADFTRWATSLGAGTPNGNAQSTFGLLGADFSPAEEVIIDVCSAAPPAPVVAADAEIVSPGAAAAAAAAAVAAALEATAADFEPAELMTPNPLSGSGSAGSASFSGSSDDEGPSIQDVGPDASWLIYLPTVRRIVDHNVVRHKPLAGTVTYGKPAIDPFGDVTDVAMDASEPSFGVAATVPDVIQQVASPSVAIVLAGTGVRMGFRVPPPRIISIGGVTPVLANENVVERTLGAPGGLVYYRTDWVLTYLVPSVPASAPISANPVDQMDGAAG